MKSSNVVRALRICWEPQLSFMQPFNLRRNVFMAACFVTLLSSPAQAEQTITVEQAVKQALQTHPSIASASANLAEQEQNKRVAKSGYYPQISSDVKSGYEGRRSEQKFNQSVTLSVSQMLYDFGKVKSEVNEEEAKILQLQAELLMSVNQVIHDVALAATESWRYQQLEKMAQEQSDSLAEIAKLVSERQKKGAAPKSDAVQSQARVEHANAQKLQFQNQKLTWQNRLANLLDRKELPDVQVDENFASGKQVCSYSDEALQDAPALQAAKAGIKAAEAVDKQASSRLYPTISLDPSVTHHIQRPKWDNSADRDKTEYGIYLNVNMPLYQGGALRAERKSAALAKEAADAGLRETQQDILDTLLTADAQQGVLTRQLAILKTQERLSLETKELYKQQYMSLGSRPLIDLLNVEQEIYSARFEKINLENDQSTIALSCVQTLGMFHDHFSVEELEFQGVTLTPWQR